MRAEFAANEGKSRRHSFKRSSRRPTAPPRCARPDSLPTERPIAVPRAARRRHFRARTATGRPRTRENVERSRVDRTARASPVETRVRDGMRAHRELGAVRRIEYSVSGDAKKCAWSATKDATAVDGFLKINHGLYAEIPLFARAALALTNGFYWYLAWKVLRSSGAQDAKRNRDAPSNA